MLGLAALLRADAAAAPAPAAVHKLEDGCRPGLVSAPKGPFAVLVSCEKGLGNFIGVVYEDAMGEPINGAWRIEERHWREKPWSQDVTSFAWAPDGKTLYVATSNIYERGGLYKVDLMSKHSSRVYPQQTHSFTGRTRERAEIESLDDQASSVKLRLHHSNSSHTVDVPVK